MKECTTTKRLTKKSKLNPTIISVTKSILELNDYIRVADLIKLVSKITGCSNMSVRGTSFGSTDKFMSEKWFYENYIYLPRKNKTPATIFKKDFLKMVNTLSATKPITISYDTEEKKQARKFIFENIENIDNPIILTLAGEEGLDVKYVLGLNEKCEIDNVERNVTFLERFKSLNLKTNNYNMDFSKFLKITKKHYHLINYDSIGYLCDYISEDLLLINKTKNTDYLCLTIQDFKTIRNTGEFANTNREKYKNFDNQTLAYLTENMTNYEIISLYRYIQNKKGMIIFKFKLKN